MTAEQALNILNQTIDIKLINSGCLDYLKDLVKGAKKEMKVYLDKHGISPVRAHETDAGLDIRSPKNVLLKAGDSVLIRTGVHVQLPHETAGVLISKSGLNVMHDITSTGLIDEGYTGEICVKLYNHGKDDYQIYAGDKISQLVVIPAIYVNVELVENLSCFRASERGENGFGSSGR